MPSNAVRLSDFGSGIGTFGAVLQVDNTNQRIGIGTTNPQSTLQVGVAITMDGAAGVITATTFVGALSGNATSATSANRTIHSRHSCATENSFPHLEKLWIESHNIVSTYYNSKRLN